MSVGIRNFTDHVDGDTFGLHDFNFFINDTNPGSEEDLTGATPKVVFRRKSYTGKVVATLQIGSGLTWIDQSLGQLRWDAFIANWGVGEYFYDMQVTYPDGSIYTKTRGSFKIIAQSTT